MDSTVRAAWREGFILNVDRVFKEQGKVKDWKRMKMIVGILVKLTRKDF